MLSRIHTSSFKTSAIPLAEILFWKELPAAAAGAKVEPLPLSHCKSLCWTKAIMFLLAWS